MNRWLIPFLVTGVVSTIALLTLSPLSRPTKATADSHTVLTHTETTVSPQSHALPRKTPQPPHAAAPSVAHAPVAQTGAPAIRSHSLSQLLAPNACYREPSSAVADALAPNAITHTSGTGQPPPAALVTALADLINQQRQRYGMTPLAVVPTLTLAAYQHSLDMATQSSPAHQGSDGSSGGGRMLAAGYQWQAWAEVIGWGFTDPDSMVTWWLSDAEHRAVLLSPTFTEFGIGYATFGNTRWQNYWTVNFGRPVTPYLGNDHFPIPTVAVGSAPPPSQDIAETKMAQPWVNPTPTAASAGCPMLSIQSYSLIPMEGIDLTHPAPVHGDLNLAQRGYRPVTSQAQLIDLAGPVDPDAPQLVQLLGGNQPVRLKSLYQVADWQWQCAEHGCRGEPLATPAVTMLGLQTQPGTKLYAPARQASIYRDNAGKEYLAVVLYAEASRLTLAYTRDGTVANGYVIHVEQVCVDPNLLQRYREADANGRQQLPALQHNQAFGTAVSDEVGVTIRDRGAFLDPRSRKDWWQGY